MSNIGRKNSIICDLRSDTFTSPDEGMRRAMADAIVGDDVYGEDPTVNELQFRIAELFCMEKALFFPTGTICLLYTSPSPRDLSTSRMPSSA